MTLPADDLAVAQAVVEEAWRLRGGRERQQLRWSAENTGVAVGNALARAFKRRG